MSDRALAGFVVLLSAVLALGVGIALVNWVISRLKAGDRA